MRRLALIAALILCCMATPARAAKTAPGDSCTAGQTNQFITSGGKETGGIVYFLECDGTNWHPFGAASPASGNAGFGYGVLYASGGVNNTAFGHMALPANTSTGDNSAFGFHALGKDTAGYNNSAFGFYALPNVTSGYSNSAFGVQALNSSDSISDAAFGIQALSSVTSGCCNLGLGSWVGSTTLSTGQYNILIGYGSAVDTPAAGTNNFLNIGNTIFATGVGTGTVAAPAGNVGIGTTGPATKLDVNGDITNENVKSCAMLGTDSNGKLICNTPAIVLISTQTASASASLQWTGLGSYAEYQLICSNIIPATNATGFYLQFGEGGGPTWKTANYRYEWINALNGALSVGHNTSDSGINFYGNADNIAPGVSVFATLVGLSAGHSQVLWENGGLSANGTSYSAGGNSGWYTGDTNPITAIQVFMSSGNITSGQCSLYGMN